MNLYILRHGIAADRDSREYPDDDLRPLTDKGIRRMRREAAGMNAMGITPDVIISSPLVRAIQTAEIVQEGLDEAPQMEISHALVPEAHPSRVLQAIAASHASADSVMVVGHEPHLSSLVSYVLTGQISWLIELKKGALCNMDISISERGRLVWALPPKQLRFLA
ncbi:MAG: phosphohistidine phosphatase SixA [Chloroflexi bacterium]|nr:phosphohistidine phosphatase SixA [Chloroflexota bacterium]